MVFIGSAFSEASSWDAAAKGRGAEEPHGGQIPWERSCWRWQRGLPLAQS